MDKEEKQLIVYYAHPSTHFNTELEYDCYEFLETVFMGKEWSRYTFEIFNPNETILSNLYKNRKKEDHPDRFDIFRELSRASDIMVMTTFLDGAIGAGVGEEGNEAFSLQKPVFLLSFTELFHMYIPWIKRIDDFEGLNVLSYDETVERLKNGVQ